ncbi:MAG: Maf family nucleotide pyrophosphatase [Xanthobacteraceae bacterium]|nr:Maf family nucleotide pyrophosphatase [Xanthobacteraceae bacterium]
MSERKPLILASQSNARQALLRSAQIPFEAILADIDERAVQVKSGLCDPGAIAGHLAREKALHVARKQPGRIVIGADQTLALGERLFSKPIDRAVAQEQLAALSGRTHHLNSAVIVVRDGDILFSHVAVADMTMRALDSKTISDYLDRAGDTVMQSVGGYQLEGLGVHLFERIEGDYFTILGLPLLPLLTFLRGAKLIAL